MARPLISATFLLLTMLYYSQAGSQAAEYLLVVGGGGRGGVFDDTLRATEVVSLAEGEGVPECLSGLADHPNPILDAAGGALPAAGRTKALYAQDTNSLEVRHEVLKSLHNGRG